MTTPRLRLAGAIAALAIAFAVVVPAASVLAAGPSISGTVFDSAGVRLSGISVRAGTISAGGFTGVGSTVTTAADGTYTISLAATGRYAVRFSEASQAHAAGYYSTAGFVSAAPNATVILVSGAVTGVNVRLPVAHSIGGTVTGTGSVALANIAVDAITSAGDQVARATTNASGVYSVKVANGSYKLRFTDPTKTYPSAYYTTSGVTTDLSAASTLVVSGSDLGGKNVQLPASRHITGTITNSSAAPVAGLKVSAGLASATTDAGGAYSLAVPPGSFAVTVLDTTNTVPSGYFHSGSPSLTTDPVAATKVNVTAGDATANIQLPAGVAVSGTVTNASSAPLPGIDVWLTPVGAEDPLSVVTTTGSGTYSIRAAPGSFVVKLMDPTAKYTSGFYRATVSGAFTKDLSVATHVAVGTSPVALNTVKMPLYNTVDRQSGSDRYATAANISRGTVPSGAPVVYVATGLNFPDALAASAAAGKLGGPVLLVETNSIPTVVKTELTRLKPDRIVVVGGLSSVSSTVLAQLDAYTTGPVQRQSGADRYETATKISAAAFAPNAPVAYIATGLKFPDALAASAAAGRLGGPVLLVQTNAIPAVVKAELTRLKPARIVVVGGITSVSNSVMTQLDAYTTGAVERQSGADRYETATKISAGMFAPGAPVAYVATGLKFPDALAASAAAARLGGPVLLVQTDSIPAVVKTELTRLKPARIVVVGGITSVSNAVSTALKAYLAP